MVSNDSTTADNENDEWTDWAVGEGDEIINDGGSGGMKWLQARASEPSGEGAVVDSNVD